MFITFKFCCKTITKSFNFIWNFIVFIIRFNIDIELKRYVFRKFSVKIFRVMFVVRVILEFVEHVFHWVCFTLTWKWNCYTFITERLFVIVKNFWFFSTEYTWINSRLLRWWRLFIIKLYIWTPFFLKFFTSILTVLFSLLILFERSLLFFKHESHLSIINCNICTIVFKNFLLKILSSLTLLRLNRVCIVLFDYNVWSC